MNVSKVQFKFDEMYIALDPWTDRVNHYTVREIEVLGYCDCHGHADGSQCPLNDTTNQRECQCSGNTCGASCDMCCPLYNQILWTAGSTAPWINDESSKCEPCNCHNHSEKCVYNQTVSDLGLSMDINGNRRGGGVCQDCKDNTRGVNCEMCDVLFYRPSNKSLTSKDACQACLCDARGAKNVTGVTFLDCVTDVNETALFPGKAPGDCFCKSHVQGRQCDTCKPGFYRLTRDNPEGCQECACHHGGTVNASNVCVTDSYGQCPCKTNVELRDCSQCKHGFYELNANSTEGCKSCECDSGGTYPAGTCNKATGQCQCRAHVTGKRCNRTEDGYYYPELHFVKAEKNPYKPATNTLHTLLHVPISSHYMVMVRFSLDTSANSRAQVLLTPADNSSHYASARGVTVDLIQCGSPGTMCSGKPFTNVTLSKGKWMALVNTTDKNLKMHEVIALPLEFLNSNVLGSRNQAFQFQCSVEANDMGIGKPRERYCLSNVFSLTAAYLNGTLPCSCDPLGSRTLSECEPYGGQCRCKPGVEGRDCGRCKPGFYNMTSEGCRPCDCKGPNSVCDPVSGECECPANKVGRTCEPCQCNNSTDKCLRSGECRDCQHNTTGFYCDKCVTGTFGNATAQQCKACDCNVNGSSSSLCDHVTGQCSCKANVVGRDCSRCKVSSYGFGPAGCTECACNVHGSASLQCDDSGVCPCNLEVIGTKCTQCKTGYFGLPKMACKACDCNVDGTVNGTVCANDTIGQCQCKSGVTGRACDKCQIYFTGFTSSGCVACPGCVKALMKNVKETDTDVNQSVAIATGLDALTKMQEPLSKTEQKLTQINSESNGFDARVSQAQTDYERMKNNALPSVDALHSKVAQQNQEHSEFALRLLANTTTSRSRTALLLTNTNGTIKEIHGVDDLVDDILRKVMSVERAGYQALSSSREMTSRSMSRDFSLEEAKVNTQMANAENLTTFVRNFAGRVLSQTLLSNELGPRIWNYSRNLTALQENWEQTHALFMRNIEDLNLSLTSIRQYINHTKLIVDRELKALEQVAYIGPHTDEILNNTDRLLKNATSANEQYQSLVAGVAGEVQVSMLEFDDVRNELMVKVLQGRNLSPRDLPSETADPYFLVAIQPDWGNSGTLKSTIIQGTLNPTWPFGEIYRFNLSPEQLKETKLSVHLYDNDPEGEDDFLGQVTIDLSKNDFSKVYTTWYRLLPMLTSAGSLSSSAGLVDASNFLQTRITAAHAQSGTAYNKLQQVQDHYKQLKSIEDEMRRLFASAHEHGSAAADAIGRYDEIEKIVNTSVTKLDSAKNLVTSLNRELLQSSVSALLAKARNESDAMRLFHEFTSSRNWTDAGNTALSQAIKKANATFLLHEPQWYEAYNKFPDLRVAAARLQSASAEAFGVLEPLTLAQRQASVATDAVHDVTDALARAQEIISTLQSRVQFVHEAATNQSRVMDNAFQQVRKASELLNNSTTAPSAVILQALTAQQDTGRLNNRTKERSDSLEERIRGLRRRLANAPFALNFTDNTVTVYDVSNRSSPLSPRTEIVLGFKTNATDGLMMYSIGNSSVAARQSGIALYLSGGKLRAEFNSGSGPVLMTNPLHVSTDSWVSATFTRSSTNGFLTVTTEGVTKTISHNSLGEEKVTFNTVTAGGAISETGLNAVVRNFTGTIDILSVNQHSVSLFNTITTTGSPNYALPRPENRYFPSGGQAASFSGAGYLLQAFDRVNTLEYWGLQLDVRSHDAHGLIAQVMAADVVLYNVFLDGGTVGFEAVGASPDSKVTVRTDSSSFNSGYWLRFKAEVFASKVRIVVTDTATNQSSDRSVALPSGWAKRQATHISFGGPAPKPDASPSHREFLAGDLRDARVFQHNETFSSRWTFTSPDVLKAKGVFFTGIPLGPTEGGATRFYGYIPSLGTCSHTSVSPAIPSGSSHAVLSSLSFTFKSREASGILLYSDVQVGEHREVFYMALMHGQLLVVTIDTSISNKSEPFVTSNMTLIDNIWRDIHLNSTEDGYSLFVDGNLVHAGWFSSTRHLLHLGGSVYIGGVPDNVTLSPGLPITWCFKGDMKNLILNTRSYELLSDKSIGVSNAGVHPAKPRPPPTPAPQTCGAPSPPLIPVAGAENGFTPGIGSGGQSYMAFANPYRNETRDTFLIELQFTALSANGLLLYIADNETHPQQFVSVELVDGKVKFQFDLGPGLVKMSTELSYTGALTEMKLLRIGSFGALLVPVWKEYQNYKNYEATRTTLDLTSPIYIGGVPEHVKIHPQVTRRFGFSGHFQKVALGSTIMEEKVFDLKNPMMQSGIGKRYSNVEQGFRMNGSTWVKFDDVAANTSFSIQLQFRTWSRDGTIFYLHNNTQGGDSSFLKLQQSSGQLNLTVSGANVNTRNALWSDPARGNATTSSHLLCNMDWHDIQITRHAFHLNMTVDGKYTTSLDLDGDRRIAGSLYIGGEPGGMREDGSNPGFIGCIRNIYVNGQRFDASRTSGGNASYGCTTRAQG
ncbi:laminin subunit alpha-1 isoform X2 [Nematostella vectensis]|nr:laminin subunit alpha-1 isoform X2 [Nematostella vectensis]